jgi:hypothetical protein
MLNKWSRITRKIRYGILYDKICNEARASTPNVIFWIEVTSGINGYLNTFVEEVIKQPMEMLNVK